MTFLCIRLYYYGLSAFHRFYLFQLTICFPFAIQIASILQIPVSLILSTFFSPIPDSLETILAFLTAQDILDLS